jgi:ATP-dependent RNA helicase DDX55/SPB4
LFRELAIQIFDVLDKFTAFHPSITCTVCVGGTNITEAIETYENNGGQVLIGTPGRILDMHNRSGLFNFKSLEVLVLDEADTLLDMGFKQAINDILHLIPKQRRTGLFSATQTNEVKELARAGMRNPVSVTVRVQHQPNQQLTVDPEFSNRKANQSTPSSLLNYYVIAEYDRRADAVINFINQHIDDKIIIFCATCACVDYYGLVFRKLASNNQIFSKAINITTFHGKMVPKKRHALYRKFLAWTSGVLFSTDVAARGIDIPDIDWIIQLAAPKDPSFFIHRVGRTARAGRPGGALIFLTEDESAYVELLRGRGVPLHDYGSTAQGAASVSTSSSAVSVLDEFKQLATKDRNILESGSTAFISFLRAYKESLTPFIFQMKALDIGSLARAYGLLRLPKIPETRGGIKGGKAIVFEKTELDTGKIPYANKPQEEARIRRIEKKKLEQETAMNDEAAGHMSDQRSIKSFKSNITKKSWVPPEEYIPAEEKRQRKKKLSFTQKFQQEWQELADEEANYKKFKKGKISSQQYDKNLLGIASHEKDAAGDESDTSED